MEKLVEELGEALLALAAGGAVVMMFARLLEAVTAF